MVKLIAQIFKIRVVAADGIVFELHAAIIEPHRPLAVNGFCNVEIVKKDRCFRVRIGASVDLTAGGQTEQAHTQTCCDEERFELHRITSVFSRITGFSRSNLEREPFFYWNVILLRMISGIVPGTQSISRRPMERARLSSSCAIYWIQS